MKWRKWNNILHRDIGYICVGLTIIYAVSGVAVNHVADWNPNYSISTLSSKIDEVDESRLDSEAYIKDLVTEIDAVGEYRSFFRPDPETLKIFLEGNTITINVKTDSVSQEIIKSRTGLREMNVLHLNTPKKAWTYFADLYAAALFFLAISGMFVLKGKNGIKGRGAWLTGIGVVSPILFLAVYYW